MGALRILLMAAMIGAGWNVHAFTIISNAGKPAHWSGGNFVYRFQPTPSGDFEGGVDLSGTVTDEFDPIRLSFETWMGVPSLDLSISEGNIFNSKAVSGDGHNTISWISSGWQDLSFRPPSYALAVTLLSFNPVTGAIEDADIYFNAQHFGWAVVDHPSELGRVDVQNVATHEIGHALGLDHSSESPFEFDSELEDATMYYTSSTGEISRRDLNNDDEWGITSLYSSLPSNPPTIHSVQRLWYEDGEAAYRIEGTNFGQTTSFVLTKFRYSSEVDAVARYRTIDSSTEATAIFDVSGLCNGQGALLATNHPSGVVAMDINIEGLCFTAQSISGGGGGGCALRPSDANSEGRSGLWPFMAAVLLLLAIRGRKKRRPA